MPLAKKPELVCPAGGLPALKAAVDNGADAVYIGLKNATNARNFAGLNFNNKTIQQGVQYARDRGVRVFIAINTYPQPDRETEWQNAIDIAAGSGANAMILADIALLDYAQKKHPSIDRHLSVQGSATNYEALKFYKNNFDIRRAVIPRVLTLAQVKHLIEHTDVEIEVFGFGSLCVMNEGRCWLSSYATGESPNTVGACSPAKFVRWEKSGNNLDVRLNHVLTDRIHESEKAGYPTLCKGRFVVNGARYYAIEEPTSLNILDILPDLLSVGVSGIKVEGRQRSPAYTAQVTKVMREAIDAAFNAPEQYSPKSEWMAALGKVSEGATHTLGAYNRPWR